ncbi:chaperone NapD [Leisingera aquaemixtae]|uniref:Chaperone NapD n=1 Tax=Leisingera aquaemixtae TaxID=1396826 RepID=A0A0P1H8A4_9RHOB|nr:MULTISPECIES: chaperone NapD [Leisingera]QDI77761.1 nitrate reductase formation protein NapD [Leisingera aquaemixtae]UWQ24540.1 chaperone NapD [Leisingera aquaemixtae]UWQ41174.1 chaperone NapD [Leisingera aquaemixtae]UWQ45432.1 chaperone NapD [Leisingera aquaemixtae]CUH99184.1 assembly protein for periplasmic nitrate reductase [Leisingera aquaemixtae]
MTKEVHISSLLVRSNPARMAAVLDTIKAMPNAEISQTDPSGKIVVLFEADSDRAIGDALAEIQLLDGVASAALVFHQTCDAQELALQEGTPQ